MTYIIDPKRLDRIQETGICVRAQDPRNKKWGNYDIAELDTESLRFFIKSRGEVSNWAEAIILTLLEHKITNHLGEVLPTDTNLLAPSPEDIGFTVEIDARDETLIVTSGMDLLQVVPAAGNRVYIRKTKPWRA